MEFFNAGGPAAAELSWSSASTPKQIIPVGSFSIVSLPANLDTPGPSVTVVGGGTLALDGTTGSWNLAGGRIRGGTVTASNGAELVFTSSAGTLDGVTAASDLDLASNNDANVQIVDGLTLNATAWLGNAAGTTFGQMFFNATGTLGGTGAWCSARAATTRSAWVTGPP